MRINGRYKKKLYNLSTIASNQRKHFGPSPEERDALLKKSRRKYSCLEGLQRSNR